VKDGVDALTFVTSCPEEFAPRMNGEHDAFCWIEPQAAMTAPEPGADIDIEQQIMDKLDDLEARVARAAEALT
jgi:hypothetical protein